MISRITKQIKDEEGWPDLKVRLKEIPLQRLKRLVDACDLSSNGDVDSLKAKRSKSTRRQFIEAIATQDTQLIQQGFLKLWRQEGKLPN